MNIARFGAVFDLDGVIVRSDRLHQEAWVRTVANRHGTPGRTIDFLRQISGQSTTAAARGLFPELAASDAGIKSIVDEKNRIYDALLRQELLTAPEKLKVPGVCELIRQLADQSVSLALNTSSPASEAETVLSAFGIQHHFSLILTGEVVTDPKPHPEGYLQAAESLGLLPGQCAGFEDSLPGLTSLNSAGYGLIVAVGSILSEEQVRASGLRVDRYIPDFSAFTLKELSCLITV